jgi:hypothetical protein
MPTNEPLTPTASGPETLGDMVAEIVPLIGVVYQAGPPVLLAWLGIVLFGLMLAGPFVLLVTLAVVMVAAAALVALAGATLATPYLLIRLVRTRIAAGHWAFDWGVPRMRLAQFVGNPRHRHQTEGMS